ncbi:MAG: PIN domain-containing protein [Nanoarchaeota archaeon]
MKILVDTNRIIAALIRKGTTRDILFDKSFEFVTPDFTLTEIKEREDELRKKTNLAKEEFDVLLAFILEPIRIVPYKEYEKFIQGCKNEISDLDDVPHLAASIATKAEGIWAHDPHFLEQKKIKVFTNIDMLKLSGKAKPH